MIKPYRGKFHTEWYPKTASIAIALNDMVTIVSTAAGPGTLALAVDGSPELIGLAQKVVAATDSDYASTTEIPVLVGDADAEFVFDVSTGSAATTDIGEMCDLDDENSIDVTNHDTGQIKITKVLSATQVVGKINKGFGKEIAITA